MFSFAALVVAVTVFTANADKRRVTERYICSGNVLQEANEGQSWVPKWLLPKIETCLRERGAQTVMQDVGVTCPNKLQHVVSKHIYNAFAQPIPFFECAVMTMGLERDNISKDDFAALQEVEKIAVMIYSKFQ